MGECKKKEPDCIGAESRRGSLEIPERSTTIARFRGSPETHPERWAVIGVVLVIRRSGHGLFQRR
jgi:hypothetical protein